MGLILVVSEDAIEIETIKGALSVHGWWVTVAGDRQVALQVAADQAPKLVIVDSGVSEATELVRSFGAGNGGPGVLVCAPEDVEGSLILREAGADEVLTKPVDGPRLLEAVQRCLVTPREHHVDRAPAPVDLLTSEQIFGDVLRELEEHDGLGAQAPAAQPPPPPAAPEVPAARVAPAAAEPLLPTPVAPQPGQSPGQSPGYTPGQAQAPAQPFAPRPEPSSPAPSSGALFAAEAVPEARPVVSLAGLFDGGPMGDLPQASPLRPAEPEAPQSAGAEDLDSLWGSEVSRASGESTDWQGSERRSVERPWSAAEAAPAEATEPPLVEPEEPFAESLAESVPPVVDGAAEADDAAAPVSEASATRPRFPRRALLIGSIAALLLIALGVIFLRNPDGGETGGAPAAEAAETAAPATESFAVEDLIESAPAPEPPADEPQLELAEAVDLPRVELDAGSDQIEDLDLQAIVDQELERREEELRQVFLEEEKRLLRELGNLDQAQEGEDGEEGDGGRTGDAGTSG